MCVVIAMQDAVMAYQELCYVKTFHAQKTLLSSTGSQRHSIYVPGKWEFCCLVLCYIQHVLNNTFFHTVESLKTNFSAEVISN